MRETHLDILLTNNGGEIFMAKYVCDIAIVSKNGENLCKAATEITQSIEKYSSTIESNLSSWEGTAKSSFEKSNSRHI